MSGVKIIKIKQKTSTATNAKKTHKNNRVIVDHPFLLLLSWTITCYSSPFCESCRASYWVSLLALFLVIV